MLAGYKVLDSGNRQETYERALMAMTLGAPYSCDTDYKCLFFSATESGYGPVACCTSDMSCAIRTACVASADFYGSQSDSACDAGCRLDLYTLKW